METISETTLQLPVDPEPGFGRMVLYNLAAVPLNLYDTVLVAWVMYFYIPPKNLGLVQYLPLGLIGIILAGGRILDAITDPLVGYLSDHTTSKWGRRKPYILISGPVLYLSFAWVWLPPVHGNSPVNAVFLAMVLFFYYWSYTGMLIPWFAFLPEMGKNSDTRVKIASIGVVIGVIGALIGGGLSGPLMERIGAFKMALVLGLIGFILGECALLGIKENPSVARSETGAGMQEFFKTLKQVFKDRQVLSFSVMIFLAQMTYQLMLMNVPYFTTLILGKREAEASLLMGQIIIIMAVTAPLWYFILKRFPKRNVFRVILVLMTIGFTAVYFVGTYPFLSIYGQAMLVLSLTIIPFGGMFATVLAVIADITDYDELKYGMRREAIYYGIYGIVRKSGWALCSLIVVGVFSLFGYSVENPQGVKVLWLVCAACCILALIAFIPFKLGDSKEETRLIMGL
jgi:GPH family glycoside/pentoside/hexuronide:cation symporter